MDTRIKTCRSSLMRKWSQEGGVMVVACLAVPPFIWVEGVYSVVLAVVDDNLLRLGREGVSSLSFIQGLLLQVSKQNKGSLKRYLYSSHESPLLDLTTQLDFCLMGLFLVHKKKKRCPIEVQSQMCCQHRSLMSYCNLRFYIVELIWSDQILYV